MQIEKLSLRDYFCYPAISEEFIAIYFAGSKYTNDDIASAMQSIQGFDRKHPRKSVPHYGQMRCFVRTQAS